MNGHECPGPDCEIQVPASMLMCRRHWYQVPKPIRDQVWAAWDHGAGAGTAEHMAAIKAAIESVTP